MAQWLKQSTSVTLTFGPFLDETDGKTAETGLTITRPDIQLSKNGGAFAQTQTVATLSHDADGWYPATMGTTDTGTLGGLIVQIHESGALPVWREFMVVPTNVWDSMFGADNLEVDVALWLGTAAATPTTAGVPEVDVTHIGGGAVPAPAVTGVPDVNITHIQDGAVPAPAATGVPDVNVTHISDDSAAADNLEAEYDGTGYKSYVRLGTAQAGAAGSITLDASASATGSLYNGQLIAIVGGTGIGQTRRITAYDGGTKIATVDSNWTTNPASGSKFVILPLAAVSATLDVTTSLGSESYAADGAVPTLAEALFMILQALDEFSISGTTITVKKLDGSTTAMTFTLDDADNPTSRTRGT